MDHVFGLDRATVGWILVLIDLTIAGALWWDIERRWL